MATPAVASRASQGERANKVSAGLLAATLASIKRMCDPFIVTHKESMSYQRGSDGASVYCVVS